MSQVAYLIPNQQTIDREFGILLKIKDNYPKLVVSMDEIQGNSIQGIQHFHLRNFLVNTFIHESICTFEKKLNGN